MMPGSAKHEFPEKRGQVTLYEIPGNDTYGVIAAPKSRHHLKKYSRSRTKFLRLTVLSGSTPCLRLTMLLTETWFTNPGKYASM